MQLIEQELGNGGELYDIRDVASKTADNAVRLAGLFQLFEHGESGLIGISAFEGASRIAAWHLNESRRFFGEFTLPPELMDAERLDAWLLDYCQRERTHIVPWLTIMRFGPSGIRKKAILEAAISELTELNRAWLDKDGCKVVKVSPRLVTP